MGTLYTMIDPYPYSQLTVHEDYKVLAKRIGYEHKFYTMEQVGNEQVDHDTSNETIFMFEPALLKQAGSGKTTDDIRRWFPNCKIVVLSSEAMTYKHGYQWWYPANVTREFEIYNGHDTDLWLDINSEIVADYAAKGLTTDIWEMTTSHFLIDQFENRPRLPKTQDMICLIGHTNGYRDALKNFINQRYSCRWGMHPSQANFELNHLYQIFSESRLVLGTSSPCWFSNRSMKGFRDWLGPICGTVLIYDNYPDVLAQYPDVPTYDYNDFETISQLADTLIDDPALYKRTLETQMAWIRKNTVAIQLYDRMMKHGIIHAN